MIRVHRARSGESFTAARSRPPLLHGADKAAIRVQLVSLPGLDHPEIAAVERALGEIDRGDVEIVVAPGGSLYRIFTQSSPAPASKAPPAPGTSSTPGWLARDRSARVLLVARESSAVRLGELLAFLGYATRTVVAGGDGASAIERALEEHDPHVVVVGGSSHDLPVVEQARTRGCAVVSFGRGARKDLDGELPQPIASDRLASVLDPLAARVMSLLGR